MSCIEGGYELCLGGPMMTEVTDAKEQPNDAQAVSIAGGSLFLIGFMLWSSTRG